MLAQHLDDEAALRPVRLVLQGDIATLDCGLPSSGLMRSAFEHRLKCLLRVRLQA